MPNEFDSFTEHLCQGLWERKPLKKAQKIQAAECHERESDQIVSIDDYSL